MPVGLVGEGDCFVGSVVKPESLAGTDKAVAAADVVLRVAVSLWRLLLLHRVAPLEAAFHPKPDRQKMEGCLYTVNAFVTHGHE